MLGGSEYNNMLSAGHQPTVTLQLRPAKTDHLLMERDMSLFAAGS